MWRKIVSSTILCLMGIMPTQAQGDSQEPPLPPLKEVFDSSRPYIDANYLRSRFKELCKANGKEAVHAALAPFKNNDLMDQTIKAMPEGSYQRRDVRYLLAAVFWRGQCVEQDRDFARSVFNGSAFTAGFSIAEFFASREYAMKVDELYAQDPEIWATSRPVWNARLRLRQNAGWFKPPLIEEPVLDDKEIEAIDQDVRLSTTPFDLHIPPARREAAILQQILDMGLDAPISVAYSLKAGMFDVPYANSVAATWLSAALKPPFEDPMVTHVMALWFRDKEFRKRRMAEAYVPDQKDRDLRAANDALVYALLLEDSSLVPLAYCLLEYQFEQRKFKAAAKPAYALLLWLKEHGKPYPEDKLEMLEDELNFIQRLSVNGESIISIESDELPMEDVNLTDCAAATGQTEFWKAEGLL